MNMAACVGFTTQIEKNGACAVAPGAEPEDGASQEFLALLLANFGIQTETEGTVIEVNTATDPTGRRLPGQKLDSPDGRTRSKDQANDVAFGIPLPIVVLPSNLPELTLQLSLDSRSGDESGSLISSDKDALALAGASDVIAKGDLSAGTTGSVRGFSMSGTPAGANFAGSASSLSDTPEPIPVRSEAAFEALIRTGVPDDSNPIRASDRIGEAAAGTDDTPTTTRDFTVQLSLNGPVSHQDAPGVEVPANAARASVTTPLFNHGSLLPQMRMQSQANQGEQSDGRGQENSGKAKKGPNEDLRRPIESFLRPPETVESLAAAPLPAPHPSSSAGVKSEVAVTSTNEVDVNAPSAPRASAPARDIAIQLQNPGGPRVDIQLMDRAGTVHVVVRTQDDDLTRDLRTNLSDLTEKLNQRGMEADAWSPVEMHNTSAGHENPGHTQEQAAGDSHSSAGNRDTGERREGNPQQHHLADPDAEFTESLGGFLEGVTTWQPTP